jgi:hypothetical protein
MKLGTRMVKETKRWFGYDAPRWMRVIEYHIRVKWCGQTGYLIDRWIIE